MLAARDAEIGRALASQMNERAVSYAGDAHHVREACLHRWHDASALRRRLWAFPLPCGSDPGPPLAISSRTEPYGRTMALGRVVDTGDEAPPVRARG